MLTIVFALELFQNIYLKTRYLKLKNGPYEVHIKKENVIYSRVQLHINHLFIFLQS